MRAALVLVGWLYTLYNYPRALVYAGLRRSRAAPCSRTQTKKGRAPSISGRGRGQRRYGLRVTTTPKGLAIRLPWPLRILKKAALLDAIGNPLARESMPLANCRERFRHLPPGHVIERPTMKASAESVRSFCRCRRQASLSTWHQLTALCAVRRACGRP